jgi:dTDP-glucose 4,6-dehydratase
MGKLLITGAAGFIARNFIQQYFDEFDMIYVDKLSECSDREFMASLPQDRTHPVSTSNIGPEWLEFNDVTHVINFAAESHVDNSIDSPIIFTKFNTSATHSLLEVCRQYGKIEKFVQVGTDEVYGTLGPDDRPFTEDTPLAPNSPYSASKAAQDMMCRAYFETFKFPVVITRCSNNYGPWQHPEKFIPKVIRNLMNSEKIPVYGNGLNVRDWIHVDDHCHGIWLALKWGTPGEVYNFGGDCELSNLDVIETILNVIDDIKQISNRRSIEDVVEFVEDRKGHDLRYAIDYWKSSKELGFQPAYAFYNGIYDLVHWAFQHKDWLDARK